MSDDGVFVFNIQEFLDCSIVSPAYGVFYASEVDSKFLLELINGNRFRAEIDKLSQGGTRISLKTSSFKDLYLTVPDVEEQRAIASVLTTADKEIQALQQKLNCLRQEKKALMQQLLTGNLRVSVEEDKLTKAAAEIP